MVSPLSGFNSATESTSLLQKQGRGDFVSRTGDLPCRNSRDTNCYHFKNLTYQRLYSMVAMAENPPRTRVGNAVRSACVNMREAAKDVDIALRGDVGRIENRRVTAFNPSTGVITTIRRDIDRGLGFTTDNGTRRDAEKLGRNPDTLLNLIHDGRLDPFITARPQALDFPSVV